MSNKKTMQITRTICLAGLALALLAGATVANARAGKGGGSSPLGLPFSSVARSTLKAARP